MKNDQKYLQIISRLSDAVCNTQSGNVMTAKAQIEEAKKELTTITINTKKKKLSTDEKIYRKLSDYEAILRKIECHTNEQLKLNRFMAKMIFGLLKLHPNSKYVDHDKVMADYWQEFCRIAD